MRRRRTGKKTTRERGLKAGEQFRPPAEKKKERPRVNQGERKNGKEGPKGR